jgi:hypothetical protein
MDADLEAMRSIARYGSCVECLLEPLLKRRRIWQMPCKHRRTFELGIANRRRFYEERGFDDPGDDVSDEMPEGYCDCIPFNRRIALWEIGDLCVKYTLTRTQMREMAAILLVITTDIFTYNHVRRVMHDLFNGAHKNYLRAYKRQRDQGVSFDDAVPGLVQRWQYRMMPNV